MGDHSGGVSLKVAPPARARRRSRPARSTAALVDPRGHRRRAHRPGVGGPGLRAVRRPLPHAAREPSGWRCGSPSTGSWLRRAAWPSRRPAGVGRRQASAKSPRSRAFQSGLVVGARGPGAATPRRRARRACRSAARCSRRRGPTASLRGHHAVAGLGAGSSRLRTGLRSAGTAGRRRPGDEPRWPPGTVSISVRVMAGLTPYQHGGASTPWIMALSETAPPIEPETHSPTVAGLLLGPVDQRAGVVGGGLVAPRRRSWKSEEATTQPSRRSAWSHGLVDAVVDAAALAVEPERDALGVAVAWAGGRVGRPGRRACRG